MMNGLSSLFKRNPKTADLVSSLSGHWLSLGSAILSGVLVGTSYIPFPPWAIFFAYLPLWVRLIDENELSKKLTLKRVFFLGWITQAVLTLIGFHWIIITAYDFGHFPWPLAALTLLAFCTLAHLHIPLALTLVMWLRIRTRMPTLVTLGMFALSLILAERFWPSLFPWHLGYTFLGVGLPIFHWADVVGFEGLSALILLVNAGLAWAWIRSRGSPSRWAQFSKSLTWVVLGIGLLSVGGFYHAQKWKETDSQMKVLVTQGNIGNHEKIYAERGVGFQNEILSVYLDLTRKGLADNPQVDLILWPETAFPDFLDNSYRSRPRAKRLSEAIRDWNTPLLTGSFSREANNPNRNNNTFNGAFLLSHSGSLIGSPYRKSMLLAFGEYLPLSERFPILLDWIKLVSNFGRGPGPSVFVWPSPRFVGSDWQERDFKLGPQICYEGLFPDFSRGLVKQGAQVLVNLTNDSWFGNTFEPKQHMLMTLARAIELRRPLLRSTNTGISTGILADGTRLMESTSNIPWVGLLNVKFKKNPPLTFYAEYGDLDTWIFLFLFIMLSGIYFIHPHKGKNR